MPIPYKEYKMKADNAFARLQSEINIWSVVSIYCSKTHYLNEMFSSDIAVSRSVGKSTNDRLYKTLAYNDALEQSIKNRVTNDLKATYNEGVLLTLETPSDSPLDIFYNNPNYDSTTPSERLEEVKKFYSNYGDKITNIIKSKSCNGSKVLEECYYDLNLFGNCCHKVVVDPATNRYIMQYIPINQIAIERNYNGVITDYYSKIVMSKNDVKYCFGAKESEQICAYYANEKCLFTKCIAISVYTVYSPATNSSYTTYYHDKAESVIKEEKTLGCPYCYYSMNRNSANTYGISRLAQNIHTVIYLQTLDFYEKELTVKEATPEIMRVLSPKEDEKSLLNNHFLSGATSQAQGLLSNMQNRDNRLTQFDIDDVGYLRTLRESGVDNAFRDLKVSVSHIESIMLIRQAKETAEQKLDKILGGGIATQLANNSLNAPNLKTKTYSEIAFRSTTEQEMDKAHYDNFLPFVSSIYNRFMEIAVEAFVLELKQLMSHHSKEDILYKWDYYNNSNANPYSNLFQIKLLAEQSKIIEQLQEGASDPEYDIPRGILLEINSAIQDYEKQEKEAKSEEAIQQLRSMLKMWKMKKEVFLDKVLPETAKYKATEASMQELQKMQDAKDAKHILFNVMPRSVLEYHIDYLAKHSHFHNVFKIEFIGSTYKQTALLARGNAMDTLSQFALLAEAVTMLNGNPTTKNIINVNEFIKSILDPINNKENLILSEKERNAINQQQMQEMIQMQEAMNNQSQNNI